MCACVPIRRQSLRTLQSNISKTPRLIETGQSLPERAFLARHFDISHAQIGPGVDPGQAGVANASLFYATCRQIMPDILYIMKSSAASSNKLTRLLRF